MIKFFRTIRQKLLSENKFSKYFLYAVGEITLVVIGIFIAIQLNEWNQNRLEKKEYAVILENLEKEFRRTEELLTTISGSYVSSISANATLMQLFSADHEHFSAIQIDTLLGNSFNQPPFYPPQPILDELLNSGKIKSIPNENLKQHLVYWKSTIRWFHFDYELFINFSETQLTPYINKHWSWKNIDIAWGSKFFKERSLLTVDQKKLFQELEFENLIDSNLFHTDRLYRRLKDIHTLIDKIFLEIEISLRP